MDFYKLPLNAKTLLDALVAADNPVQLLCERWDAANGQELDELKGIIKELQDLGYIKVKFADNRPYIVTLHNSARTYSERLAEYEERNRKVTFIIDQSVRIGDGNKISKSNLGAKKTQNINEGPHKKNIAERHPIIASIIAGLVVGVILMFSFWKDFVAWVEGLF